MSEFTRQGLGQLRTGKQVQKIVAPEIHVPSLCAAFACEESEKATQKRSFCLIRLLIGNQSINDSDTLRRSCFSSGTELVSIQHVS